MTMENGSNRDNHDELPVHIAFGLMDETAPTIDSYVATAQERIEQSVDAPEMSGEAVVDLVAEALPYEPSDQDREEIDRERRRLEIIMAVKRRRRFGQPILKFSTVHIPTTRR